jgi:hypothetical protein
MIVDLEQREWNQIMQILANREVWAVVNPLLMKMGQQLEGQFNAAQERVQQGNGKLEHQGDDSGGPPAQPSGRGGIEHGPQKQARKT